VGVYSTPLISITSRVRMTTIGRLHDQSLKSKVHGAGSGFPVYIGRRLRPNPFFLVCSRRAVLRIYYIVKEGRGSTPVYSACRTAGLYVLALLTWILCLVSNVRPPVYAMSSVHNVVAAAAGKSHKPWAQQSRKYKLRWSPWIMQISNIFSSSIQIHSVKKCGAKTSSRRL
jgi:hypothetical protein